MGCGGGVPFGRGSAGRRAVCVGAHRRVAAGGVPEPGRRAGGLDRLVVRRGEAGRRHAHERDLVRRLRREPASDQPGPSGRGEVALRPQGAALERQRVRALLLHPRVADHPAADRRGRQSDRRAEGGGAESPPIRRAGLRRGVGSVAQRLRRPPHQHGGVRARPLAHHRRGRRHDEDRRPPDLPHRRWPSPSRRRATCRRASPRSRGTRRARRWLPTTARSWWCTARR
jgi:hypothetical protein